MRAVVIASLLAVIALAPGCYRSTERGSDAGVRSDAGATSEAGAPVRCDEESLPPYPGPPCSDAVNACRDACPMGDETCRDACFDDACRACVYGTIFHCANVAGCEPLWRTFACCIESQPSCGDLRGFDRVMCAPSCPMQFEAYAMCIEPMGGPECFLEAARNCHLR